MPGLRPAASAAGLASLQLLGRGTLGDNPRQQKCFDSEYLAESILIIPYMEAQSPYYIGT